MEKLHAPKTAIEQFIFNGLVELGLDANSIEFKRSLGSEKSILRFGYWSQIPNFDNITWLHDHVYEATFYDDDCGWLTMYEFKTPDTKDLHSIVF